MVTHSLRQFSMQVDGICNGGVATIEVYEIINRSCCCGSVECTRVMTIPGRLPKHNTNKSFRICAKVMYTTRIVCTGVV